MTLTRLPPLPDNPLPDRPACTGLWELFDSRRATDHWKARRFCEECPMLDGCRPPERFFIPALPGIRGRPMEGTIAMANGTWGGRLYRDGEEIDVEAIPDTGGPCKRCGAPASKPCVSENGAPRRPHKGRPGAAPCATCDAVPATGGSAYCDSCRRQRERAAKDAYDRRRGAA